MDSENPFAALVEETSTDKQIEKQPDNNILEDIFGFTINEEHAFQHNLVFLQDIADAFPNRELDLQTLEHALFDRLFLEGKDEVEVLNYLYECYCKTEVLEGEMRESVRTIIMRDIVTSLMQPDLYTNQENINNQFFNLLKTDFCSKLIFLEDLYNFFIKDEGEWIIIKKKLTYIFCC